MTAVNSTALYFSIIIPVYNVVEYLRPCLDSVLAQTFSNWEAICVDDGSTDGSAAILDEYAGRDKRFRVIHQKNAGVSVARNAGLDAASGEWIAFVDSDDYLGVDFLTRIQSAIVSHSNVDCVGFGATWLRVDGTIENASQDCSGERLFEKGDDVLGCFRRNDYSRFVHCIWDKAYRRSVLEKNRLRFPVGIKLSEDSHFAQMYLLACGAVYATLCPFGYYYRQREGSAVRTIDNAMLEGVLELFRLKIEAWKVYRTKGFTWLLAMIAAALPSLGRDTPQRAHCIDALLMSPVFTKMAIPFLLWHGRVKGRIFAGLFLFSPGSIRRRMLNSLNRE